MDRSSAFTSVAGNGSEVPLFLIEFDAHGRLCSPQQRDALVDAVRCGAVRDVHLYSHGWNNVFDVALARYDTFFRNYLEQRTAFAGAASCTDLDRTAFAGVIWPSTALVSADEAAPRLGAQPQGAALENDRARQAADDVALALDVDPQMMRAYLDRPVLSGDEAAAFAALVFPLLALPDEVLSRSATTERERWRVLTNLGPVAMPDADDADCAAGVNVFATVADQAQATMGANPSISLDPRAIVRALSVYVMKDRARTVGANGVGPALIGPVLDAGARLHLIGHSFGSAVLLSAICAGDFERPVWSALLLEPAVSWLCFSSDVGGVRGGYQIAPERSVAPILTTHSARDNELTNFYKIALLRKSDVGDPFMGGDPFERFRPLGGYGPSAAGLRWPHHHTELAIAGTAYARPPAGSRIVSFDGSRGTITGHGDVDNAHTTWLHACNVDGGCFVS